MNRVDIEKAKEWIDYNIMDIDKALHHHERHPDKVRPSHKIELLEERKAMILAKTCMDLRVAKKLVDNRCQTCGTEYEYNHPEQSYMSCFDCGQQLREVEEE